MTHAPDRPASGTTEAATFRIRGVAVPFTAPMLASARVRSADRDGVELILPNPSGGPGVLITNWSGAASLRGATMHDTLLFHRVARLGAPDPRSVREAALSVAEEGYADPAAADAARLRRDSDKTERLRLRDLLIGRFEQAPPAEAALARVLGVTTTAATTALRICCEAIAPIGLAPNDPEVRMPRTIASLDTAARDIAGWIAADRRTTRTASVHRWRRCWAPPPRWDGGSYMISAAGSVSRWRCCAEPSRTRRACVITRTARSG